MILKYNCYGVKLYQVAKEEKCLDIPILIWVNIAETETIICTKFLCLVCLYIIQIKYKCNNLSSGKIQLVFGHLSQRGFFDETPAQQKYTIYTTCATHTMQNTQCAPPTKVRGELKFCVFVGSQNIFDSGGLSFEGEYISFGEGQFILRLFPHFET